MPHVKQIIGPPGCGKTTKLGCLVQDAVRLNRRPLVCSLTRAAAVEVVGRNLPISDDRIGTLHSHAFVALDRPKLVYGCIQAWNEEVPAYAFSGGKNDADDLNARTGLTDGDIALQDYELARHRMVPRKLWSFNRLGFAAKYEAWKEKMGVLDFTDLIEQAPGRPPVPTDCILVDEAQDCSRLELEMLRQWAECSDELVIVGDPWQALYEWRGAAPEMFDSGKVKDREILSQSYRIPRAVHALACEWIKRLSTYELIEYRPRDADGESVLIAARLNVPSMVVAEIEDALSKDKTVMVAATCGYMLRPLLAAVRERGIPFSNPWRRKRGDWNPLAPRKGVSTVNRVLDFLAETSFPSGNMSPWTWRQLDGWVSLLRSRDCLVAGTKGYLKAKSIGDAGDSYAIKADVLSLFSGDLHDDIENLMCFEWGTDKMLAWFQSRMLSVKAETANFPMAVIRNQGTVALSATPRLHIGTIHSFKGAEADVVILFPDLSPQAMRKDDQDSVIRTFYVGITRAKEKICICKPVSGRSVDLWEMV